MVIFYRILCVLLPLRIAENYRPSVQSTAAVFIKCSQKNISGDIEPPVKMVTLISKTNLM